MGHDRRGAPRSAELRGRDVDAEDGDGPNQRVRVATRVMARQLAHLAHMIAMRSEADAHQAFEVIQAGFSLSGEAREAICLGRIGLSLSGGGFRAALFHIGVLARLAELDLLRHVEVISCVSGAMSVWTAPLIAGASRHVVCTTTGSLDTPRVFD